MGIIRRPWLTRASEVNLARTLGLHPYTLWEVSWEPVTFQYIKFHNTGSTLWCLSAIGRWTMASSISPALVHTHRLWSLAGHCTCSVLSQCGMFYIVVKLLNRLRHKRVHCNCASVESAEKSQNAQKNLRQSVFTCKQCNVCCTCSIASLFWAQMQENTLERIGNTHCRIHPPPLQ